MKKKLLTFLLTALLAFGVGWAADYVKVTSTAGLTNGQYLIVYEGKNVAFNGGLTTFDAPSNTIPVTISNGKIASTSTTDAASFTIDVSQGTIKSASKYYIGNKSNSNALSASTSEAYTNTLSIETNGDATIVSSGGAYLRYNATSGQDRFRYFKSSTYTSQKAIQLYKLEQGTTQETVATPAFSPEAGNYTSAQNVTISCATSGATIYYTTDGTTPTTSSAVYSAAIPVSETTTIKAIAVKSGMTNSEVAEATYTISATPELGNYYVKVTSTTGLTNGQYLIVSENEDGNVAFNGGLATLDAVSNTIPVTISNNKIESTATTDAASFTIDVSNGAIKSASGNYIGNGSDSNALSTSTNALTNTLSITVSGDATIKASGGSYLRYNATNGQWRFRYFKSSTYTGQKPIQLYKLVQGTTPDTVATPAFSPAGGTYSAAQNVTISCATEGATIYYTTDGNDPTTSSDVYSTAIPVSETTTIKAIAVKSGMTNSEVATAVYTINIVPDTVATPAFSPAGGTYSAAQNVTISCATSGATIYYTTDGTTPTTSSNVYSAAIPVSETTTIKAIAVKSGMTDSEVATATYTIESTPTPSTDFTLVTDASQLAAGDEIIIANSGAAGSAVALSTNQTTNNRGETSVTISNDLKITNPSSDVQIITLEGNSDGWYFNVGNGYLYAASSNANHIKTKTTKDDNAKAAISISDNVASVIFQGDNTHNVLQYNSGSHLFSCYSGATQKRVYIYHRAGTPVVDVEEPEITPATGTYYESQTVSIDVPEGTTVYYTTDGSEPTAEDGTEYTGEFTATYTAGGTTTVKAIAIDGNGNESDVVSVEYTWGTFSVTISPATQTFSGASTVSGTITATPSDATVEYSFDNTTWVTYTDGFTTPDVDIDESVTVYARATKGGATVTDTATYTREALPAPAAPTFTVEGGAVEAGTVVTITAPEGCTLFVNGTAVTSPYEMTIDEAQTVTAYAVNSEGTQSTMVSYSFTIAAPSVKCEAVIEFKNNDSDAGTDITDNSIKDYYVSGAGYISSITDISKVYKGLTGLKFSSSSVNGNITFNLAEQADGWRATKITLNAKKYGGDAAALKLTAYSEQGTQTPNSQSLTESLADYEFDLDGRDITGFKIAALKRAYLKSITIEYICTPIIDVEEPEITPATGTYYESQTVSIDVPEGTTVYYTTDGSEPTAEDGTEYTGEFTATYTAGGTTTVKAIAIDSIGNASEVVTATYTWGKPAVSINPGSRNVTTATQISVSLSAEPEGCTIYYTTDGSTPTASSAQYDGTAIPVSLNEVGDQVVIKAIAVINGLTSDVATATYKYVEQLVNVNAPFFSPLVNNTYYGDQTLEIGCTTNNADIYYEITEVTGATAPAAGSVSDPGNNSTFYNAPVPMTVGHSYYVKAVAYVGSTPSTISEGWYIIKDESEFEGVSGVTYVKSCKEFNDLTTTGVKVRFMNPVQVVYHSTYTNNGEFAEYCYVRDNSDYACVYFGKRDTGNKTIYQMGDWIDGSQIEGEVNIWDNNFHNQLGTSSHSITSWPSQALGWSEVIPNTATCAEIAGGTTDGANLWGNYVHVRYTTMSDVHDYSTSDPKHTGYINDPSGVDTYYDKFYRWSAGTCSYQNHNEAINCLGDYDQEFFTAKQNAGATFDVYGVVDYYKPYDLPFEICPIDFLWIYKPVVPAGGEFTSTQTINLTATQPEWAAEGVVIYYKTDDMEDWAVYNGPFDISSTTTLQAYAEVPAKKNDTAETDYNDYVRSVTVSATYTFTNIADPVISPESCVIEVNDGTSVSVSVATNSTSAAGTVTIYTTNGEDPRTSDEVYTVTDGIDNLTIDETTTVTAISYIVVGEETIWSNPVSETYTFVKKNGVEYTLCKTAPVVGNVYVIVNKAHQMGLSTQQNANNRGSVGVMFKDNTGKDVVYGNDELAQFTLEAAVGGRYYFKTLNGDQAGYLCVETNDRANLVTEAAHDDNGADVASVSIGASNNNVDKSYIATISYSYNGVTRYLRYFNNGHIFSTYTDGALNEDVFLYGIEATPLAYVEASGEMGKQYTISDQLIGAWAVNDGTHRYLWAKDQGNLSIDKTFARADQTDYMCALADQDIAMGQTREWDQSNWVILDFGGLSTDISPEDYVGMRIQSTTVKGEYVDDMNFRIALGEAPTAVVGETATGYPGYTSDPFESNTGTDYWYNQYTTVNFVADNLNVGTNEGAVAGAASPQSGRPMFFMNPKIQEIAHVWAVYAGTDNGYDKFDVYECADGQNFYDLSGSFWVSVNDGWLYNKLNTTDNSYGRPDVSGDFALAIGGNYAFHVAVNRTSANYGPRRAAVKDSDNDADFKVYPLDIPAVHLDPTGVTDLTGVKTVSSVRYYNIMGMESEQPIEGVNIVVTRYTDGTSSTVKVMR